MRQKYLSLLLLSLVLTPMTALADGLTIAAKVGPVLFDIDGADDTKNGGINLSYEIGAIFVDVAVEAEATTTLDKGDDSTEITTGAAYLAVRTPGPFYFIGRAGVIKYDVSTNKVNENDTGESYGVGLGISFAVVQVELEYTAIDGTDIQFASIGVRF